MLRTEEDPVKRKKLFRKAIRTLVRLGDLEEARKTASELSSEYPDWQAAWSMAADIACRSGKWEEAERLFEKAAAMHAEAGDREAASRLRTGPLFILAEARKDYARCEELCRNGGETAKVLTARSRRLAGKPPTGEIPHCRERLASKLAVLENAWKGRGLGRLAVMAAEWGSDEPEWRWRFVVEGIHLWKKRGMETRKWRKAIRGTVPPVLDPRFDEEWRILRR